jgi:hypothetical protein
MGKGSATGQADHVEQLPLEIRQVAIHNIHLFSYQSLAFILCTSISVWNMEGCSSR